MQLNYRSKASESGIRTLWPHPSMTDLARRALAGTAALVLGAHPALAQTVSWASKPADTMVTMSGALLGPPDGVATSVDAFAFAYVREFVPGRLTAAALERALKLPAGELAKWDLIAFEAKAAGEEKPFDGSMWMVQDMQKLVSAVYDNRTNAAAAGTGAGWSFRTGYLSNAQFKALVPGTRYPAGMSWILIRLPTGIVDKRSPNLAVWMGGGPIPGVDTSPAPDAIGVIR